MSFATGFFSAMARDLESRGEYIREQRAKRKDYLMTYGTRAVVEREELANKAISVGRMLEAKGFDAEDINYIVGQAGPNALGLIYEEIKDIPKERLTKEVIDPIIKLPETYKPAGMSYEEAVRKAFGLYKGTATDDPAENQQRGLFSGMLFNPDAANSVLDEEYISGFTGRDIYRIMGTPTPGLTGTPDLDFSALPATYSIAERRELVRSVKDHMLGQASKKVASVSSDDYTKMSAAQKQQHDLLKAAVNNENYGVILEKMPELKTYILDFDRETRGGLRYNSVFSSDPAFKGVFDEAVRQVEVADTGVTGNVITPEKDGTLAPSDVLGYTQMRDSVNVSVPPVNELPVFSSEREARESGETFFIVERNGKKIAGSNLPTDTTPDVTVEDDLEATTDLGDMSGAPGFRTEEGDLLSLVLADESTEPSFFETLLEMIPDMPGYPTKEEVQDSLYKPPVIDESEAEMEERIRDDARQFLQDEKSFPQPLPTIVIEKAVDKAAEEAKVDRIIVANLDMKGEAPTREDFERIKTILEQEQLIDTETQELYRGPISGKTLVEKLNDIWNFYTSEGETEYNPRTVGTVGFQDLGLRHTTDDVRERQNQPAELQMSAARGPSPTEDSRIFDKPKNMAVEGLLTRRSRGNPTKPVSPTMDKDPDVGGMGIATLAKRVHGDKAKAVATFEKKLSSGKVTAADVARMIKATDKLPETANKAKLLVMLYDLRDSINKR